jgi:hypothetical protein
MGDKFFNFDTVTVAEYIGICGGAMFRKCWGTNFLMLTQALWQNT